MGSGTTRGEKWGQKGLEVGGKGREVGEKEREAEVLRRRESFVNKCLSTLKKQAPKMLFDLHLVYLGTSGLMQK